VLSSSSSGDRLAGSAAGQVASAAPHIRTASQFVLVNLLRSARKAAQSERALYWITLEYLRFLLVPRRFTRLPRE